MCVVYALLVFRKKERNEKSSNTDKYLRLFAISNILNEKKTKNGNKLCFLFFISSEYFLSREFEKFSFVFFCFAAKSCSKEAARIEQQQQKILEQVKVEFICLVTGIFLVFIYFSS